MKDRIAKEKAELKHRLTKTQMDIEQTRLDTELIEATARRQAVLKKAATVGQPPASKKETLEKKFAEAKGEYFDLDEIYYREKANPPAAFKDKPDMLKQYNEWLDGWREKHLLNE